MDALPFPLFLALAAGIGLLAVAVPPQRGWWPWAAATAVLTTAGLLASASSWLSVALLSSAELAAAGLVQSAGTVAARDAARRYLLAIIPAIIFTVLALALTDHGLSRPGGIIERLAVALLVTGFALKLALVPVYFWLPRIAAASPAVTTALIVAVIDMAGFGELYHLRLSAPWLFTDYAPVWLTLAAASMLGGVVLALAQSDLKTMLAFSSIDDMGYLLVGLVAGGSLGLSGAALGAASHALCKLALFGAVGMAEARLGHPVTLDDRGVSAQVPLAGGVFLIASLGFLGVPPGLGFTGHWRLYLAALEAGGPVLLGAMALASVLGLICYVRAIHQTWLGPAAVGSTTTALPVPRLAAGVLVALVLAIVILGLAPAAVLPALPSTLPALAFIG